MSNQEGTYYLPQPSGWPLVGSIALFTIMLGAANWVHGHYYGPYLFFSGMLILIYMFIGWFGVVIRENQAGLYDQQVDKTFRWSMAWFIFSEIFFFACFFGALFYTRIISVPQLAGAQGFENTHYLLWPSFKALWPLLVNPDNTNFTGPEQAMLAWGVPAINTLILLSSGVTVTWAHHALKKNHRKQLVIGLLLTVFLGITFLCLQAFEYGHAYEELGLKLSSGIYGTTFFMLTGFHGAHVTLGTIMLIVILGRSIKGHFTPDNHFAFEGVAWYWHFVDVVWLFLFIFVYWL